MATRNVDLHRLSLLPTGTLVQKREGDAIALKWVYQRVGKFFGNIPTRRRYGLQLRRHVIPADPQTPAQLARRQLFADAILAWRALSPAEKKEWTVRGRGRALPGYQFFLSTVLKQG